jgi:hypothetical protein
MASYFLPVFELGTNFLLVNNPVPTCFLPCCVREMNSVLFSEPSHRRRQRVQPMDPTFDETLTLWTMHGKITIEQLEYWNIMRKRDNVI